MAWSLVQSIGATGASGTTLSATLGSTPVTGNKIIVWAAIGSSGTVLTVSSAKDGNNVALTALSTFSFTGANNTGVGLFAYDVPASPSTSFTVTFSATGGSYSMLVEEVSGLLTGNTSAMLDGSAGTNHATASPLSATYSSTASNEYLTTFFGDNGAGISPTMPSGYTADTNDTTGSFNADVLVGHKNSTNGSEANSWTWTGSDDAAVITVAFKLPAAGGGTAPAPATSQPRRKFPSRGFLPRKAKTAGPPLPPQVVHTQFLVPEQPDYRRFNPWRGFPAKKAKTAGPPLPPQPVLTQFLVPQQPAERLPRRWFLRRAYTATPVPAQQDPYHQQALPPQQPVRRRLFQPKAKPRTSTPVPGQVVVVTVQALPPQQPTPFRRFQPRARARVATPPQPVVQFLPPQQPRPIRRFQPRAKARQAQPVPAQVVVQTTQALPPQQPRPVRQPWLPRPRRFQAMPVVIVYHPQPLPPQQPTPLRRFQPRARARQAQPVPPQVIIVPHPIPPQTFPHRWRWITSMFRRGATQTRFPFQAPTTPQPAIIFNRLVTMNITGPDPSMSLPGPWTVNVHGGGLASLFLDDAMLQPMPNPIIPDGQDVARFYAANGFYDVLVTWQGVTYVTVIEIVSGPPPTYKTQTGAYWLVYDSRPTGEPWLP